jgi:hypothetical protein
MSVPTPVGYDADHLAAFNRLNELRVAAGLGMLAQDQRLDQAAQAHANWIITNDLFEHDETLGSEGFSGVDPSSRAQAAGYPTLYSGEVMSSGAGSVAGIDLLFNIIYHRLALLQFDPVDVGIGWSPLDAAHVFTPLVIDFSKPKDGSARSAGQLAQAGADGVVVWPLDGARELPTHMGYEIPNPVPSQDVGELGTPASVEVDKDRVIQPQLFALSEDESGAAVPATVLTRSNDPNGLLQQSSVGLIPTVALRINTTYRVDFIGSITLATGASLSYSRTWRFRTGGLAYLPQH